MQTLRRFPGWGLGRGGLEGSPGFGSKGDGLGAGARAGLLVGSDGEEGGVAAGEGTDFGGGDPVGVLEFAEGEAAAGFFDAVDELGEEGVAEEREAAAGGGEEGQLVVGEPAEEGDGGRGDFGGEGREIADQWIADF